MHNEKAVFIECSAVYIVTEPKVNDARKTANDMVLGFQIFQPLFSCVLSD